MKNRLYSYKNDAIRPRFLVRAYLNLFTFKRVSCLTGYAHFNPHILLEPWINNTQLTKAAARSCSSKCFLENFAILTRKHLCWSFLLIKFQALRLFLYNTTSGCFRYYRNYSKVPGTNIKYFISCRVDLSEAVVHRCSVKKMFLEISQNLQENTCARG